MDERFWPYPSLYLVSLENDFISLQGYKFSSIQKWDSIICNEVTYSLKKMRVEQNQLSLQAGSSIF